MSSKTRTITVGKLQPGHQITDSGEYFEGEIVAAIPEGHGACIALTHIEIVE